MNEQENTFKAAAEEARIMAEMPRYRMYRIEKDGKYLTLWNGESPEHAKALCADYYRISINRLRATLEP